ncbi:hypothetical protein FRAAL2596 [Frankia alni ACN14a]|uniref:Uncharacterized protein n=1 Tax=Frankia alni (strain DSM 45986 / CECT 9034 / ACN14a) TaxID=326424 RepID=Q0RMK7_FRAAA|nr:hypothetical protein FRAAL2596 [Frankia alni ACN14a]
MPQPCEGWDQEGADVAFTYTNSHEQAAAPAEELQELGRSAIGLPADSADAEALSGAVNSAAELRRPCPHPRRRRGHGEQIRAGRPDASNGP